MVIREKTEDLEQKVLSPYAALSSKSKGRQYPQEKCDIRTEFQRDRDRILHCKSFRRLKHKTQVFIAPEGDHFRTRLTHTLEVSQISRTIARALRLNEDLTEAIALGHDLGHTPFGHMGERVLDNITKKGFRHNIQSLRVVEVLEGGNGLNLTQEVRDGIRNHSGSENPTTLEGWIVRLGDRIAYINHDIDDAIRANIISNDSLPISCTKVLGKSHGQRINKMVEDVILNSMGKPYIKMSKEVEEATYRLRRFMFDKVYTIEAVESQGERVDYIIKKLFCYFSDDPHELPEEYYKLISQDGEEQGICDYIAGMTDRYALGLVKMLHLKEGN